MSVRCVILKLLVAWAISSLGTPHRANVPLNEQPNCDYPSADVTTASDRDARDEARPVRDRAAQPRVLGENDEDRRCDTTR